VSIARRARPSGHGSQTKLSAKKSQLLSSFSAVQWDSMSGTRKAGVM
jgi:hypothetical protein